ncbi:hypothetical protein D0N36_06895 [Hymenobacter lapidiphilus]|uniref:hypothetical protein n=1 Tax=Hymenobacter sp. CCM 8763 TaxID=2303334 RepID=UPI000E349B8F|nr:hypothetical protein [Hymenobacter sp. CCM 8763]RFP65925.1 hypothetical protein D0N36_06895 [Hymenobacter sp. CCM 8763]
MANEITEIGQIVTYGGQQLTLTGSVLASQLTSLLTREGSGGARGWRIFDPAKAEFLSSKKILNPGDIVLVNAKTVPMNFTVQSSGGGGGSDIIILSGPAADITEFEELFTATSAAAPAIFFSSGAGSVQYSVNNGSSWAALPASIPANTPFRLRVQHSAAFSASITLTYA